jgi:tRNA (cytidine32/uridine32-2'-O)-methyltransferase
MTHEVNKAAPPAAPNLETGPACLQRIRVVLVGTTLARNIGSSARAMRAMGLTRLYLVRPSEFPHDDARKLAAGADDVLDGAVICADLAQALHGCVASFGTSARRRSIEVRELSPRQASAEAIQICQQAQGDVALVFGAERVGLHNDELKLCHARIEIPTDPHFSSLNLAQAVQLIAYELRLAALDAANIPLSPAAHTPAPEEEFDRMMQHLEETLGKIHFYSTRNPELVLTRLRRLYQRAQPDHRELSILRGIFRETQRTIAGISNKKARPI